MIEAEIALLEKSGDDPDRLALLRDTLAALDQRRRREAAARRRIDKGLDLLDLIHARDSIPEVKDTLILTALIFHCSIE